MATSKRTRITRVFDLYVRIDGKTEYSCEGLRNQQNCRAVVSLLRKILKGKKLEVKLGVRELVREQKQPELADWTEA